MKLTPLALYLLDFEPLGFFPPALPFDPSVSKGRAEIPALELLPCVASAFQNAGRDPGVQHAETELFWQGDGGDLPKVGQGNEHPESPGMQR